MTTAWGQRRSAWDMGIAECNMAGVAAGLAACGKKPFMNSFAMFSAGRAWEQVRNSIAYPRLNVKVVGSHGGLSVGEDGATHQPIEHLAALRATPGLRVERPCDVNETREAWVSALLAQGPTALILTRQNLRQFERTAGRSAKGGYVLFPAEKAVPDVILMGSGSEVALLVDAQAALKDKGIAASVVSMPCMEDFLAQDKQYRDSVLPPAVRARLAVEAGATMPWYRFTGLDGKALEETMAAHKLPGLHFRRASFVPTFSKHQGQVCHGVQMHITNREEAQSVLGALMLLDAIRAQAGEQFEFLCHGQGDYFIDKLLGTDAYRLGLPGPELLAQHQPRLDAYRQRAQAFHLYK